MPKSLNRVGNFLILGTQRTGSQALYGGLDLHPDVVCGGEWTLKSPPFKKIYDAERALAGNYQRLLDGRPDLQERYASARLQEARWLGFKVLFRSSAKWLGHPALAPALWVDRLEGHLRWLRYRPDVHIIQLVRRDPIEWLKSKYLSRATGRMTNTQYPDGIKVKIPIAAALRALATKRMIENRISELAASNPFHRVVYEDFLADNRAVLESCLKFLNCNPEKLPRVGFRRRQSRAESSDYIENYQELLNALEMTGAWPPA